MSLPPDRAQLNRQVQAVLGIPLPKATEIVQAFDDVIARPLQANLSKKKGPDRTPSPSTTWPTASHGLPASGEKVADVDNRSASSECVVLDADPVGLSGLGARARREQGAQKNDDAYGAAHGLPLEVRLSACDRLSSAAGQACSRIRLGRRFFLHD